MMKKYIAITAVMAGVTGSFAASATDFSVDADHTTASRGFGAIDHVTLTASTAISPSTNVQGRLETKTQASTATSSKNTGHFIEGIASYQLSPDFYGMTRVGFTDEIKLFVNQSLYQEFGYKYGKIGAASMDLNAGMGTREFPVGTEKFLNIGPTFSWASGAIWLRREQSLDGGGFRHVLSASHWFNEKLKIDAALISERRKKYTLPVGGTAAISDVAAERYSVGLMYKINNATDVSLKAVKISLEKSGVAGKYYDPTSFGVGLNVKY